MVDFVEAKFKYLATFEEFGWMPYLIVQDLVHENLVQQFFSNATLENTDEEDEDLCRIVATNTFLMGVPIQVTQDSVATAFDMLDEGFSDEYTSYPTTMLIPDGNAPDLPLRERLLHLFVSHFFRPIGSKHTTIR